MAVIIIMGLSIPAKCEYIWEGCNFIASSLFEDLQNSASMTLNNLTQSNREKLADPHKPNINSVHSTNLHS